MSHIIDDKKDERSMEDLLQDILVQLKINNQYLLMLVGIDNQVDEEDAEIKEIY